MPLSLMKKKDLKSALIYEAEEFIIISRKRQFRLKKNFSVK